MEVNRKIDTVNAPLFRDPIYDAPTDPVIIKNNKENNEKNNDKENDSQKDNQENDQEGGGRRTGAKKARDTQEKDRSYGGTS